MADIQDFQPDAENVWDDGDGEGSDGEQEAAVWSGSENEEGSEEEGDWAEEDEFGANFAAPLFADDPAAIWDHDPMPDEIDGNRWGDPLEMHSYGIAATPYVDDHLGLSSITSEWAGERMYGWEAKTREKGANLYTTLEEKLAIPDVPIQKPSDEAMKTGGTPVNVLSDDVLRLVFDLFVPPADIVPVGGYYSKGNLGRLFLDTVLSVMKVSRRWYHAIMDFRAMWAAYVPAAKHDEIWHILVERAGNANLRLCYCAGISPGLVTQQLHRASAIYVTDDHPWQLFSPVFAGQTLPHVEILFVKPHERYMPKTPLTSHIGASLSLPRLRVLETSTPFAVIAPLLEEVGLSYHSREQLGTILTPHLRPIRLVINRPREAGPFDWTDIVRGIDYSQLCMLKVRALDAQSGRLNMSAQARLELPCLNALDATGPVAVKAYRVHFVKVFNVLAVEMLWLLEEMLTVGLLYVRWSPSEVPFVGYLEPLRFEQLTQLSISGDLSRDTLAFLTSIRAPALEELQLFARMVPPPDHSALRPIREFVQNALVVHAENRDALVERLHRCHRDLRRANHDDIGDLLRAILFEAWAPPSLQEVRQAAQNLVSALTQAEAVAPVPHGGVLLAEIAQAASLAACSNVGCEELRVRRVWGSDDKVDFEATLRMQARECLLRFSLQPSSNGWGIRRDMGDSLTFRVAHMLFGLQVLHPSVIHIKGEPFSNQSYIEGHSDMDMLLEVLATYETVEEIHLDLEREWSPPRTLFRAIAEATVLPGLKRITVITRPSHRNAQNLYDSDRNEISFDEWILIMDILRTRNEGGVPIDTLALQGEFCIRQVYAGEAEDWAGNLDLEAVQCQNPEGSWNCRLCSWRD